MAGINAGSLADTLTDRAITLELRRKTPQERVDRLRHAEPGLFDVLASKLAWFADDYREKIRTARPNLPSTLHDRAQDNWEPLLAIADIAGSDWPERAAQAALKLSSSESEALSIGVELLADIKEFFDNNRTDKISTAELIEALCSDEANEKPWATYNRGKPISYRQIAKRLGEYGVKSKTVRIGRTTAKGFEHDQFKESFARYLPDPPEKKVTPSQPTNGAACSVTEKKVLPSHSPLSVTPSQSVTDENVTLPLQNTKGNSKLLNNKEYYLVTDKYRGNRKKSHVKAD